jgi:phage/plasmid-like protein (TIGR03299 family)
MSHEFESGFSVRQPAWHGLAQVLDDYPGREQAMMIAGHNWTVIEQPVFTVPVDEPEQGLVELPGFKALIRSDTKKPLSVMNSTYKVVQNSRIWDIVDAMIGLPNVKYETAGVLQQGRVLWVLAKLDEPAQIPGDNTNLLPYVCVSTTHDGFGALVAQATTVRVICMNTFKAADMQTRGTGTRYTFRHSKNVENRIEDAKAALGMVRRDFNAFIELSRELAEKQVTDEGVKDFLAKFIPNPPADICTPRVMKNIEDAREKVNAILVGATIPDAHRRTAYGLVQAGVEYLDHIRGFRSPETYFRRCVLDAESLKGRLVELATSVAN